MSSPLTSITRSFSILDRNCFGNPLYHFAIDDAPACFHTLGLDGPEPVVEVGVLIALGPAKRRFRELNPVAEPSYFPLAAAQPKFAASSVLPLPLYCATSG
jgi:hypothetical protein